MKKILFVCTGNTCRSPMAQAIFNKLCPDGFIAASAGISCSGGKPISENSRLALEEIGISIDHKSQPVTYELLSQFDYVVGITSNHAKVLIDMFPQLKDKIFSFPTDVTDPYGMGLEEYTKCRDIIYNGITEIIQGLCVEDLNK